jgi:hypothetical protein
MMHPMTPRFPLNASVTPWVSSPRFRLIWSCYYLHLTPPPNCASMPHIVSPSGYMRWSDLVFHIYIRLKVLNDAPLVL